MARAKKHAAKKVRTRVKAGAKKPGLVKPAAPAAKAARRRLPGAAARAAAKARRAARLASTPAPIPTPVPIPVSIPVPTPVLTSLRIFTPPVLALSPAARLAALSPAELLHDGRLIAGVLEGLVAGAAARAVDAPLDPIPLAKPKTARRAGRGRGAKKTKP